jgi:hypothetical protein
MLFFFKKKKIKAEELPHQPSDLGGGVILLSSLYPLSPSMLMWHDFLIKKQFSYTK